MTPVADLVLVDTCISIPFFSRYSSGGHAGNTHARDCGDTHAKPGSHDNSRIAWAKLMARVGEEFPLECPNCGGDIRLREDGRQEPAYFEPEVRKRKKARMASPA